MSSHWKLLNSHKCRVYRGADPFFYNQYYRWYVTCPTCGPITDHSYSWEWMVAIGIAHMMGIPNRNTQPL